MKRLIEPVRPFVVAMTCALLLLCSCDESDAPTPDRMLRVAKVENVSVANQEVDSTVRYWSRESQVDNPDAGYGSTLGFFDIDTATVEVDGISIKVLFAYCKRARTHVGFRISNHSSKNVRFGWTGLTFTPRAFSFSPFRSSGARANTPLSPQALCFDVKDSKAILIDKSEERSRPGLPVSDYAYRLPMPRELHSCEITNDTERVLDVPAHSEAVVSASFKCRNVKTAEVDIELFSEQSGAPIKYRFDMEVAPQVAR